MRTLKEPTWVSSRLPCLGIWAGTEVSPPLPVVQLWAPPPGRTGCGLLMVPGSTCVCEPGGKGPPIPSPVSQSHACSALAKAADGAGMAGTQSRWSASQKLKDIPGGRHGWRERSEGRTQGLSGGGRRRGAGGLSLSLPP